MIRNPERLWLFGMAALLLCLPATTTARRVPCEKALQHPVFDTCYEEVTEHATAIRGTWYLYEGRYVEDADPDYTVCTYWRFPDRVVTHEPSADGWFFNTGKLTGDTVKRTGWSGVYTYRIPGRGTCKQAVTSDREHGDMRCDRDRDATRCVDRFDQWQQP
jgi:hypothetical protein